MPRAAAPLRSAPFLPRGRGARGARRGRAGAGESRNGRPSSPPRRAGGAEWTHLRVSASRQGRVRSAAPAWGGPRQGRGGGTLPDAPPIPLPASLSRPSRPARPSRRRDSGALRRSQQAAVLRAVTSSPRLPLLLPSGRGRAEPRGEQRGGTAPHRTPLPAQHPPTLPPPPRLPGGRAALRGNTFRRIHVVWVSLCVLAANQAVVGFLFPPRPPHPIP